MQQFCNLHVALRDVTWYHQTISLGNMALPTSCRLLVQQIFRFNSSFSDTSRVFLTSNFLLNRRQLTYGKNIRISPSLAWRSAVSRRSFRRYNITSNVHANEKSQNEDNSSKRTVLVAALGKLIYLISNCVTEVKCME